MESIRIKVMNIYTVRYKFLCMYWRVLSGILRGTGKQGKKKEEFHLEKVK